MAGAITYAASRSIDEITAGSIPVSRGGSIPVSAKVCELTRNSVSPNQFRLPTESITVGRQR